MQLLTGKVGCCQQRGR